MFDCFFLAASVVFVGSSEPILFSLRLYLPHNFSFAKLGCLVTCGIRSWKSHPASRHGRVVAAAGVHPAAILYDIVAALPIWAAMYASHFKRVRTQHTGSLTLIQPLTNACRAAPAVSASSHLSIASLCFHSLPVSPPVSFLCGPHELELETFRGSLEPFSYHPTLNVRILELVQVGAEYKPGAAPPARGRNGRAGRGV